MCSTRLQALPGEVWIKQLGRRVEVSARERAEEVDHDWSRGSLGRCLALLLLRRQEFIMRAYKPHEEAHEPLRRDVPAHGRRAMAAVASARRARIRTRSNVNQARPHFTPTTGPESRRPSRARTPARRTPADIPEESGHLTRLEQAGGVSADVSSTERASLGLLLPGSRRCRVCAGRTPGSQGGKSRAAARASSRAARLAPSSLPPEDVRATAEHERRVHVPVLHARE